MSAPDTGGPSAVTVGGREVPVSSLDRVLWPAIGFTKRDLLSYYVAVADVVLPHLVNRPATLHRFPEGVTGRDFYQTRCPPHPAWVRTQRMHVFGSAKDVDAAVIDDLASLVWAVNLSTIEFHPCPPAGVLDAAALALVIREVLEGQGLATFVKTSGGKGIHVHVPLAQGQRFGQTKAFARAIARALTARRPDDVTDVMTTSRRVGKVFIDWSQNDPGRSTVAPYSLRGLAVPTVATPVTWGEVERAVRDGDRRALAFSLPTSSDDSTGWATRSRR